MDYFNFGIIFLLSVFAYGNYVAIDSLLIVKFKVSIDLDKISSKTFWEKFLKKKNIYDKMQTNDPTGRVVMEDLSDRSENSLLDSQVHGFQDYDKIKELNLSLEKNKDESIIKLKDFHFPLETCREQSMMFEGFPGERNKDHSVSLEKSKDFTLPTTKSKDPGNYPLDRSSDADSSLESLYKAKDSTAAGILFSFTRDGRQKSFQASLDRTKGPGLTIDREIKSFGMLKNNFSIDPIKEFNLYFDRMRDSYIGNIALDRIPSNALPDAPSMLESNNFRNLQIQPRSPDLETITLEGMRRSHLLNTERSPQNLATQLPHSITHMQHSQQQQQQQQSKLFTIDYILGHKNNPREKHQRAQQHQFRKHQGSESSPKNGSSSTSSTGPGGGGGVSGGSGGGDSRSNGGGKSKRVRTIFTAEQLERLEGEFARQQYMVGPERLYLAHALRLTEAQVKVWFQNRRIKWRKHHHEQQSQQLREIHQRSLSSLEHEDCEEAGEW